MVQEWWEDGSECLHRMPSEVMGGDGILVCLAEGGRAPLVSFLQSLQICWWLAVFALADLGNCVWHGQG